VVTPWVPAGHEHVYHQYTIRVPEQQRDALKQHLEEVGVRSAIYYPIPIHKQPYYTAELGYALDLPESERAADEVLSLPVHPGLSEADLEWIIKPVNEFMAGAVDANQ
jgi:dTDP-4-amino-4,6-dideoxygalactose transaminase